MSKNDLRAKHTPMQIHSVGTFLYELNEGTQCAEHVARLFAAAPDLLAACRDLLNNASLFNRDTDACWIAVRDAARAAIAKAEGSDE